MTAGSAVRVRVPGDKSMTHRALLLAGLADGTSRLRGLLPAADPRATARALRALGIDVPRLPSDGSEIMIYGRGPRGFPAPADPLDCGNSGTTARLLMGVLAGTPVTATITGDASLRSRPMRRVTDPLAAMGARFEELGAPDRLPIRVTGGTLRSTRYSGPRASAQVKSALLLAGVTGGVAVEVIEPAASRDHSERMLTAMGARVETTAMEDGGRKITLDPTSGLAPLNMTIPGDFSSAAFPVALALLAPGGELRIERVGVNPTRTGFLDVLDRMGARIEVHYNAGDGGHEDVSRGLSAAAEPVADLIVRPGPLRAVNITGDEIPGLIDEVPILAILAARADGLTRITGAGELRVKESDRLAALVTNLRGIGVDARELPDGLTVTGTDAPLEGRVNGFGDHRIAMAFGVLAASPATRITIDGREAAAVSHPKFWTEIDRIADLLGGM